MWRPWTASLVGLALLGCGSDETLSPPSAPEPAPTQAVESLRADAGVVDVCGAIWGFVQAPGMSERLCVLQATELDTPEGVQQCKLCAAGLDFAERLLPDPVCYAEVEECPVGDAALSACFATLGEILTELVPGCTAEEAGPVDTTQLGLRIATSSCAPVLVDCKPVQELVVALIGTTF